MEYSGLLSKYPVNRPLNEQEKANQLHQDERLDMQTADQFNVIRINSNFMELSDKYFTWIGFLTMCAMLVVILFSVGFMYIFYMLLFTETPNTLIDKIGILSFCSFLIIPFVWYTTKKILLRECFSYTHYPMILNRQTRMVHVFKVDGSILSAKWDELYFCMAALMRNHYEIQGHVLADDGETVLDTFAFAEYGVGSKDREMIKHYWEFVRRYMEEGPAAVSQGPDTMGRGIEFCLPIATQREPYWCGFHRMRAYSGSIIMTIIINVICYPGRYLAMMTSKIPQWPQDIIDQNPVPENDPHLRDATTHPWDKQDREKIEAVGLTYESPRLEDNKLLMWLMVAFWVSVPIGLVLLFNSSTS